MCDNYSECDLCEDAEMSDLEKAILCEIIRSERGLPSLMQSLISGALDAATAAGNENPILQERKEKQDESI